MGCNLYSECKWKNGDILGAYVGELIFLCSSNTEYCHEIFIGPEFEKMGAPVAYIDAEKCGYCVRSCNHSCENNANICEKRVEEKRILVLRAAKQIVAGEQICIDYGGAYFRDGQCMCDSVKCRYSDAVNVVTQAEALKPAPMRAIKSRQPEKNRSIRCDPVLEMDFKMEIEM